jgi:small subunit ribosomal protein S21
VTKIIVKEGEPLERALKRFKKKVEAAGIIKDVRRREHYLKPSIRKKEKRIAAEKRRRRSANRAKR